MPKINISQLNKPAYTAFIKTYGLILILSVCLWIVYSWLGSAADYNVCYTWMVKEPEHLKSVADYPSSFHHRSNYFPDGGNDCNCQKDLIWLILQPLHQAGQLVDALYLVKTWLSGRRGVSNFVHPGGGIRDIDGIAACFQHRQDV